MKRLHVAFLLSIVLTACKKPETESSANAVASASTVSVAPAANGTPGDPSGDYTIRSASNPGGGGGYAGTVHIEKTEGPHLLSWNIKNSPPYKGVGLIADKQLAVGWGMGERYGVAVYMFVAGKAAGRWAHAGMKSVGTENLDGPASLDGVFKITKGIVDGKNYTGTVTIKPTGSTYAVTWKLPSETYSGVGIKEGDTLTVGWGVGGKGAGVVSYTMNGSTLDGKWATPGGTSLGSEVLAK